MFDGQEQLIHIEMLGLVRDHGSKIYDRPKSVQFLPMIRFYYHPIKSKANPNKRPALDIKQS